jgi:hypothetical protein
VNSPSERFPAKWAPVRVKKTRQNKEIEPSVPISIGTEGSMAMTGISGAARANAIAATRMTQAQIKKRRYLSAAFC